MPPSTVPIIALLVLVAGVVLVFFVARVSFVKERMRKRLQAPMIGVIDPNAAEPEKPAAPVVESIFRRYYWVPVIIAITVGLLVHFLVGFLPTVFDFTIAIVFFVIAWQIEEGLVESKKAKCDSQLAEALDQMISAIRAGGSVVAAMERAAEEGKDPLKSELVTSLGLIRYGENSSVVMRRLMERVPLESFQLFAITMAVHFEVGGSWAPTLAIVAGIVRDRIEISARIRSLTAQSRASTYTLVALTYGICALMVTHDPTSTWEFVSDPVGSWFVAATMIGEAVGFVWLTSMAKIK